MISYVVAVVTGAVDLSAISEESWVGLPPIMIMKFDVSAIITIMPIALATMMEHIGDISAIGATTGNNYIANPGLHRTLLGDGLGYLPVLRFRRTCQYNLWGKHRRSGADKDL